MISLQKVLWHIPGLLLSDLCLLLQGLVQRNLPIIGDFLTQLLNLVEGKGSGS